MNDESFSSLLAAAQANAPWAFELPPAIDGWLFGLDVAHHNTQDTNAQVPDEVPAGEGAPEQFGPQETPGSAATADERRPEDPGRP